MIYKVLIANQLDTAMTVTHTFEKIVDTVEEARQFGVEAGQIAISFNEGFAEGSGEDD